jgi:long-chain acyl-CoA synthetase
MQRSSAKNLVSVLGGAVQDHGQRPLFGVRSASGWSWVTYAEFARRVDALRAGLGRLGVRQGGRVAVISRNRVEWAVGCYASAGLGAAYVPMYEQQAEREWKHILEDSGATVCLFSGATVGTRVGSVLTEVPGVVRAIDFDAPADDPGGYSSLIAHGEAHPLAAVTPQDGDLAVVVYTSGTTGRPKGVKLTQSNIVSNVRAATQVVPVGPEDRTVAFLPWAHVFGAEELHGVISVGASMALSDVDGLASALAEIGPTLFLTVPKIWSLIHQDVRRTISAQRTPVRMLLERGMRALGRRRRGERLSPLDVAALGFADRLVVRRVLARLGGKLRYTVCAAAALPAEVGEFIEDLGITLLEAYGLTESSACATINPPGDRRPGSVGKAIPGIRVTIDPGVPGAPEGAGEIVIHGHGVMAGYLNLPEETAKALTADGGLRTGDLGRVDPDGFLHVTGRAKELYKLENGRYVAPAALEDQLTRSSYIEQALVYGADRPHNVALIVPHRERIVRWARENRLAPVPFEQLLSSPEAQERIRAELEELQGAFRPYERIRAFALIPEPFSIDNGLLTPTHKARRREILARYGRRVEVLYGEGASTSAPLHGRGGAA